MEFSVYPAVCIFHQTFCTILLDIESHLAMMGLWFARLLRLFYFFRFMLYQPSSPAYCGKLVNCNTYTFYDNRNEKQFFPIWFSMNVFQYTTHC